MLVQWLLRNEFGRNLSEDEVQADGSARLNQEQIYIFEATNRTFSALAELLTFAEQLASFSGVVNRLEQAMDVLNRVDKAEQGPISGVNISRSMSLTLENL